MPAEGRARPDALQGAKLSVARRHWLSIRNAAARPYRVARGGAISVVQWTRAKTSRPCARPKRRTLPNAFGQLSTRTGVHSMSDKTILQHIGELMDEEHRLLNAPAEDAHERI